MKAEQIDKIVCDWTLKHGVSLTTTQLDGLVDMLAAASSGSVHKEHLESKDCWCGPELINKGAVDRGEEAEVWVHRVLQ